MPSATLPAPGPGALSLLDGVPLCEWCGGVIPATSPTGRKKRPSVYCSKKCRQASHRFGRAGADFEAPAAKPMRFAYADPPYPGMARRCYGDHPEYAGEVDHRHLLDRLEGDYPDGWALSTSPKTLFDVAGYLAERELQWWVDYRVGVWTRPAQNAKARRAVSAWEPVIFRGGRERPDGAPKLLDWIHAAQPREWPTSGAGRVTGRVTGIKPSAFSVWVFRSLGALPIDELDDVYPGSGAVGEAWRRYVSAEPEPEP